MKTLTLLQNGINGLRELYTLQQLQQRGELPIMQIANKWVSTASLTDICDKLESKGLVERNRSRADRRLVLVSLTEKGHELLQE